MPQARGSMVGPPVELGPSGWNRRDERCYLFSGYIGPGVEFPLYVTVEGCRFQSSGFAGWWHLQMGLWLIWEVNVGHHTFGDGRMHTRRKTFWFIGIIAALMLAFAPLAWAQVDDGAADDLPVVTVFASDGLASEAGLQSGTFTVSRNAAKSVPLTVRYTVGGSATGGSDYLALPGSVVIPGNMVSALVTVTPLQDTAAEDSEKVTVRLLADAAYSVGSPSSATITISDDDGLPVVRVVASDATATEQGPTTGTFTIHRSGSTASGLTVEYTFGGTAENGTDYKALPGSVVIPAGQSSVKVTVSPFDDGRDEKNETVTLTLRTRSNYAIGSPSTALVTIIDKDGVADTSVVGAKAAGKDVCKQGGWASFGHFKNQGDCVSWFATGGKNPPTGAADNVAVPAGIASKAGKDVCKQGGWVSFGHFKNQGDCVSWYATGGKNPPAGG